MGVSPFELRRRSAVATCAATPNGHVRRTLASAVCTAGAKLTISPYLVRSPWCMALSAADRSAAESK